MAKRKRKTSTKRVSISVFRYFIAVFLSFFVLQAIDNWLGFGIFDSIETAFGNAMQQESSAKNDGNTAADEDLQIHFIDVGRGETDQYPDRRRRKQ